MVQYTSSDEWKLFNKRMYYESHTYIKLLYLHNNLSVMLNSEAEIVCVHKKNTDLQWYVWCKADVHQVTKVCTLNFESPTCCLIT